MKKIAIVTGSRAEYGLLRPLIKAINLDSDFELQLIVSAMHLSKEFGYTVSEIIADGFPIVRKIECLLSSDTAIGISKSMALALSGFSDAYQELNPDFVILLGDRTEIFSAAIAAMTANIPIGHIHGGETTEGAYDEGIRHAITKLSYLHFTSAEEYRKRVIQLGENPNRVFNVGAIGLDSIKKLNLLNKIEFEKSINFKLNEKNILVTYHPVTLENISPEEGFNNILSSLDQQENTHIIFTFANSDKNGRIINDMIKKYVSHHSEKSIYFKSLGQLRYLSALNYVDMVIGNSSSGIIEVPQFNIPTINIGDRQKGRLMGPTIFNCNTDINNLLNKIELAFSFDKSKEYKQPYGNGTATEQIINILKENKIINMKKKFYDIEL